MFAFPIDGKMILKLGRSLKGRNRDGREETGTRVVFVVNLAKRG